MLAGICIGYVTRKRSQSVVHRIITVLIWILLFLLGIEVGRNETIIQGLHTLGLKAVFITLAGVAGSILASWGLWVYISSTKKNHKI